MSTRDDEELLAIPSYSCPECRFIMDMSKQFDKMGRKEIRDRRSGGDGHHDVNLVVVTCGNYTCSQYNRFKVVRLPRVKCATIEVELKQ